MNSTVTAEKWNSSSDRDFSPSAYLQKRVRASVYAATVDGALASLWGRCTVMNSWA